MAFQQKYLKYKSKYLELKNQIGGGNINLSIHNNMKNEITTINIDEDTKISDFRTQIKEHNNKLMHKCNNNTMIELDDGCTLKDHDIKNNYTIISIEKKSNTPIFFHKENEAYGEFSNFYTNEGGDKSIEIVDPTEPGTLWTSSEQYFMARKAKHFGDNIALAAIKSAQTPARAKELGRTVKNFDANEWSKIENSVKSMEDAVWLKFSQNPRLRDILISTGEAELYEAAPNDRVWGIGYSAQNAVQNKTNWGCNYLGQVLMNVRARLQNKPEKPYSACNNYVPNPGNLKYPCTFCGLRERWCDDRNTAHPFLSPWCCNTCGRNAASASGISQDRLCLNCGKKEKYTNSKWCGKTCRDIGACTKCKDWPKYYDKNTKSLSDYCSKKCRDGR